MGFLNYIKHCKSFKRRVPEQNTIRTQTGQKRAIAIADQTAGHGLTVQLVYTLNIYVQL